MVKMRPLVSTHYLGHASFILQFDNKITILTDYGTSNAYGLKSPIYGLGNFKPDIVTYSHNDIDHNNGIPLVNIPHILTNQDSLKFT